MPPGDREDLNHLVERALKQLPAPRAPRTLVPRVMAAIEAKRVQDARARPWLSWPLAWQVASVTVLFALGIGIARLWPYAESMVLQTAAPVLAEAGTFVAGVVGKVGTVVSVTRIVWHALVQPLVAYVLVLVLVMCAACATFGAALGRVIFGGVPQT